MAQVKPVSFHVPPDAAPSNLLPILETLKEARPPGPRDNTTLFELIHQQYSVAARNEPVLLAEDLGLINREKGIQLTNLGRAVMAQHSAKRNDLLHYLLYSAWDPNTPAHLSYLWSYRTTCDKLWEQQRTDISKAARELVEDVISHSRQVFEGVERYDASRVSFSDKSIRGVRRWLENLSPPVIEGNIFSRRAACSAELLVMSTAYMYCATGAEPDMDLLLTPERRQLICRVALLDPQHLDRLLDWVIPIYPAFLAAGTRTGSYGRFIRMPIAPTLEELLSANSRPPLQIGALT